MKLNWPIHTRNEDNYHIFHQKDFPIRRSCCCTNVEFVHILCYVGFLEDMSDESCLPRYPNQILKAMLTSWKLSDPLPLVQDESSWSHSLVNIMIVFLRHLWLFLPMFFAIPLVSNRPPQSSILFGKRIFLWFCDENTWNHSRF